MAEQERRSGLDLSPNLLDRAIGYFSPGRKAKRIRARAIAQIMEHRASAWDGASGTRRSLKEWGPGIGSADADLLNDLRTLRARSRDMARNNPHATGALNQDIDSIVGSGIRVKPSIDRELLGMEEEEADAWERRAQMLFRAWAESESCDLTRTDDFYGLEALALRATLESGDALIIRRMVDRPADVLSLKVQIVEADRVSNPRHRMDTEKIAGGVEVDPEGAPVAYHVQNVHPGDRLRRAPSEWTRVPAFGQSGRLSFLLYEKQRPGQSRGVPRLAPVIEPLKQLDRYTEAELMGTVVDAMFTVFIKTDQGYGSGELGLPSEPTGEDDADEGDIKLGHGSIVDLAPGEEAQFADPTRPNNAFDPFVTAVLRQVGAALSIPYEVLVMQYGESYSAARAALQQAWQAWFRDRSWFVSRFCQRIYEWAIDEAVARQMIAAPGYFEDPLIRRAWLGAKWTGPSKLVIREDRQVEAAARRVEEGFSTREEETASLTGGDWERNHRQRRKEEDMRRAAGLVAEGEISERALEPSNADDETAVAVR